MRIRAVESSEELQRLEPEWGVLYAQSDTDNPFLSWDWCALWWKHFGGRERLLVLVAEDDAGPAGIAPLAVRRGGPRALWRGVIHFVGDDGLADYSDFLAAREGDAVVRGIVAWLRDRPGWGVLDLRRVPEESPILPILHSITGRGPRRGGIAVECRRPYVDLSLAWSEYFAGRSRELRQELRTTVNRLRRMDGYRYEVCGGEQLERGRETLYALHLRRQARKVGRSVFDGPAALAFFDELTEARLGNGGAEVSVLRSGDRLISVVLALRMARTLYYWIPTFDEEVRAGSIGKLHLMHVIEDAAARKLGSVDLMIGDERYKLDWATGSRVNWRVALYRDAAAGLVDSAVERGRHHLRRVKNRSRVLQRVWTRMSKLRGEARAPGDLPVGGVRRRGHLQPAEDAAGPGWWVPEGER